MKIKSSIDIGKILVVNALNYECPILAQRFSEIGRVLNLDVVIVDYDNFIADLVVHLHNVAREKYSAIVILVGGKKYFKSLVYSIIELEEMGANLLVVLPKQLYNRVAKFKLNVLGVEEFCSEIERVVKEVKKMVRFPVKNIYLVEYPKPVEKALNEGLLLVIDLPLKASRRWILLKYFSGDRFVREEISKNLDNESERKLRDLTMKLWCDLGMSPAYEINKAKERLIDKFNNSLNT